MNLLKKLNLAFCALLLCTLSCTSTQKRDPEMKEKQILRVNLQTDPASIHPHTGTDLNCRSFGKSLFEGLMRIERDGTPQPATAEHVEISPDKTRYTFTLRPTQWSNGKRVTAYDFEASLKKAIGPKSNCLRADLVYPIKNAKKAKKGEISIDKVGVKATNDNTLIVDLEHPTPYFLDLIANPQYFPVYDNQDVPTIFNGPFVLDYWKQAREMKFVKNSIYWDSQNVQLDEIIFSIVKDPNTSLLMYEKGELDWMGSFLSPIPVDALADLSTKQEVNTQEVSGIYWFYCNTEKFPLNSAKIRKALACAIDRKEITDQLLFCESPTRSVVPRNISLVSEEELYPDGNIEMAKKLFEEGLQELNITKAEFPRLKFNTSDIPTEKKIAEAIAGQWEKALDIEIEFEAAEWNVFFSNVFRDHQYQVSGIIFFYLYNDPMYALETFDSRSHFLNASQWENPHYSRLIELANQESDPIKRNEHLKQAELLLLDEMPVIPLYIANHKYIKNENVQGIYFTELGMIDFKWAYLEAPQLASHR